MQCTMPDSGCQGLNLENDRILVTRATERLPHGAYPEFCQFLKAHGFILISWKVLDKAGAGNRCEPNPMGYGRVVGQRETGILAD